MKTHNLRKKISKSLYKPMGIKQAIQDKSLKYNAIEDPLTEEKLLKTIREYSSIAESNSPKDITIFCFADENGNSSVVNAIHEKIKEHYNEKMYSSI